MDELCFWYNKGQTEESASKCEESEWRENLKTASSTETNNITSTEKTVQFYPLYPEQTKVLISIKLMTNWDIGYGDSEDVS